MHYLARFYYGAAIIQKKQLVELVSANLFSSKQRCKEVFEIIKILKCLPIYFFVMHTKNKYEIL